jgi:hypothetical protein
MFPKFAKFLLWSDRQTHLPHKFKNENSVILI